MGTVLIELSQKILIQDPRIYLNFGEDRSYDLHDTTSIAATGSNLYLLSVTEDFISILFLFFFLTRYSKLKLFFECIWTEPVYSF
jgi:hypothetical protein